jgi:hypothetical protein
VIESALIGLAIMGIQLAFIDQIIKKRSLQKEKKLWTPFRIIFFQAICDHHLQLMDIYKSYVEFTNKELNSIRSQGFVKQSDIKKIQEQIIEYQNMLSDYDKAFHNVIQTVSASLQPEAAEYCNESIYFSYIMNKYFNEVKIICVNILKIENLDNNDNTSHPLNGIDAKKIGVEMIVETRLKNFLSNFSNSLWKTEGLYYFKGDIMDEIDYRRALQTEKSVNELAKIPRTMPIKNFFETKEEFDQRTKKH